MFVLLYLIFVFLVGSINFYLLKITIELNTITFYYSLLTQDIRLSWLMETSHELKISEKYIFKENLINHT